MHAAQEPSRAPVGEPEVHAFVYHNALEDELRADLRFLADNGYETLTATDLVDVLLERRLPPSRAVALTFDDALVTLLSTGVPLLQEFDARATVFAITGLTPDGEVEPRGDDSDFTRILGWDDLRRLRDSGRFEVGSHGHLHNPVWTGKEAAKRVSLDDHVRIYDVPVPWRPEYDAADIEAMDGRVGRPSAPLFATHEILIDGELEPAREYARRDLVVSADALETELGVERFHLALPYGAGHEEMPELARECGFESLFWCGRADRSRNRPGDDAFRIVRRKMDFVRRLPGEGRRSLLELYAHKVRRRLTSDPWR